MRTRFYVAVICLAGGLGGAFQAAADLEVSAGISVHATADFYQPLAANGAWVDVGSYGRCWHPAGVTAQWRPYCQGDWEWTDSGWYWESDEPWAWACYHYGTWVLQPSYGWVWVPGVEWAPAWVNWRTGGDYVGWAPCGPSGFTVEPADYVFVENRHFHDHIQPRSVIVNNRTIINQTKMINSATREQRPVNGRTQTVVVNNGPGVAAIEKATGHKFSAVPVQKAEETTVRRAPAQLRRPATEPGLQPLQHPVETPARVIPSQHQEVPREVTPTREVTPGNRSFPTEQPVSPKVPERTIPVQPGNKEIRELPKDKVEQHPKTIVPPGQAPHAEPVAPEKGGAEKGNEERGQDQGR